MHPVKSINKPVEQVVYNNKNNNNNNNTIKQNKNKLIEMRRSKY